MSSIYTIGVTIALTNNMSGVLNVIQRQILGLHNTVNMTTGGMNRMKLAVAGAAGVTIGGAMLTGLYKLSEAADKYTHQLEQMKIAGMNAAEQQLAINAANRVSSSVLTTTPTDNLQSVRELRAALNSAGASPFAATQEAAEYLGIVQKAQSVMASALGSSHRADVYELVKGLEDIGATQNPERFASLLDGLVRASITQGGKLSGRDFFQTLKYTRGAGGGYSDEFITKYLPTLMQELKAGGGSGAGGGAGNPLASFYQAMVGGNISNKAANEFDKLGLLDPSKVIRTSTGAVKGVAPGGFERSDLAVQNPYFWVRDVLMPALKAHNITNPEQIREELAHLFTNRTSQQMASLMMMIRKMEGDRKLYEGTMNLDAAYAETIRNDPVLTRMALHSQWERFQTDLGKSLSPAVNSMIFQIANGLKYLSEVIERHPIVTKWVLAFVAVMGGFLTIAGTVALAVAAFAALGSAAWIGGIAAAIIGFGAAIAGLATLVNWAAMGDAIAGAWRSVWGTVSRWAASAAAAISGGFFAVIDKVSKGWLAFSGTLTEFATSVVSGVLGLADRLGAALTALVQKLVTAAEGVFKSLGESMSGGPGVDEFGRPLPGANPEVHKQAYHPPLPQGAGQVRNISYLTERGGDLGRSDNDNSIAAAMSLSTDRVASSIMDRLNGARVIMDGRTVGALVLDQIARTTAAPASATTTGFNRRMTPMPTGIAV